MADLQYKIPMPGSERVFTFAAPFPVSESEWAFIMTILDVMKPGLVTGDEGSEPEGSTQ